MSNIQAQTVFDLFESSFVSQVEIPLTLEEMWLQRAVARFSLEISPITYDSDTGEIDTAEMIVADTLALYMLLFYKERDKSRLGLRGQIVTPDLSINGGGSAFTAAKNDYDAILAQLNDLLNKQKHPSLHTTNTGSETDDDSTYKTCPLLCHGGIQP